MLTAPIVSTSAPNAAPRATSEASRGFLRKHGVFLAVLAVIVALRIWFVFTFPVAHDSDYRTYYEQAQSLAGLRPPAFEAMMSNGPKFLYSVPFRLFGSGYSVIGITNTLLYAAGSYSPTSARAARSTVRQGQ